MLNVFLSSLRKKQENLRSNKKGFTLIELIVVIAILGILAAILIPSIGGMVGNAKHQSGVSDARNIFTAFQSYASSQDSAGSPLASGDIALSATLPTQVSSVLGSTFSGKITTADPSGTYGTGISIFLKEVHVDSTGAIDKVVIEEKGVPGDNGGAAGTTPITYPQGS